MKLLASPRVRLFLCAWVLFSVHFATNIVREHYPAFTLIERGDFRCDDYYGLHPDIFQHRDGHCYINNQVTASVLAAVPLLVFDPALDALEDYRKQQLKENPAPESTYHTKYSMRRKFLNEVRKRGLDLRFGAATVVTSAFFMAPLSAAAVVLMFVLLMQRGVSEGRAAFLAALFGFATPVLFRTAHLNHNLVQMHAAFAAFACLWPQTNPVPKRLFWAGFLAGLALALDYSGVVFLLVLYGYLVLRRWPSVGGGRAWQESLWFVVGSVPPVALLCLSQWWMFGDPFLPAQFWMEPANFTSQGMRGFTWPSLDLAWMSLVDLQFGLYAFGPLLLVALFPAARYGEKEMIFTRAERRMVVALFAVFLVFCASNQYSRMQWNTGIRYFMLLIPFLFLAAADHLARMNAWCLIVLALPALVHSWVIAVIREQSVVDCWLELAWGDGMLLPWLSVAAQTSASGTLPGGRWLALGILLVCGGIVWWLWNSGKVRRRASPMAAVEGVGT